jgi:dephospho-CoA kinase
MALIIGLTGGIGSGKTTIANHIAALGIPVYIADDEARKISQSPDIIEKIKNTFGETIFDNAILNREKLSQIVFADPLKLKQLNAIIHPVVKMHFDNWIKSHQDAALLVYEAAILFESGSYKKCDFIISIIAPLEVRIQRVIERDHATREQVVKRINAQWTDEQRSAQSNFIIENIKSIDAKKEIDKILKILKNS